MSSQPEFEQQIQQPFLAYANEEKNSYAKDAKLFNQESESAKFVMDFTRIPEFQAILKEHGINKGFVAILDTGDNLLSPAVENPYSKDKDRVIYLTTGFFRRIKQYLVEQSTMKKRLNFKLDIFLVCFVTKHFIRGNTLVMQKNIKPMNTQQELSLVWDMIHNST
jgi:hypothetical protein